MMRELFAGARSGSCAAIGLFRVACVLVLSGAFLGTGCKGPERDREAERRRDAERREDRWIQEVDEREEPVSLGGQEAAIEIPARNCCGQGATAGLFITPVDPVGMGAALTSRTRLSLIVPQHDPNESNQLKAVAFARKLTATVGGRQVASSFIRADQVIHDNRERCVTNARILGNAITDLAAGEADALAAAARRNHNDRLTATDTVRISVQVYVSLSYCGITLRRKYARSVDAFVEWDLAGNRIFVLPGTEGTDDRDREGGTGPEGPIIEASPTRLAVARGRGDVNCCGTTARFTVQATATAKRAEQRAGIRMPPFRAKTDLALEVTPTGGVAGPENGTGRVSYRVVTVRGIPTGVTLRFYDDKPLSAAPVAVPCMGGLPVSLVVPGPTKEIDDLSYDECGAIYRALEVVGRPVDGAAVTVRVSTYVVARVCDIEITKSFYRDIQATAVRVGARTVWLRVP